MKKILIQGGREYLVTDRQGRTVSDLMSDKNRTQQAIDLDGDTIRVSTIKGVYGAGADPMSGESPQEKFRREFSQDLEEYKNQSVEEKVRRDFYSRFGGQLIARYGVRAIFGDKYANWISSNADKNFDNRNWRRVITTKEMGFRQQKIEELVNNHQNKDKWLAIKDFMREFYTQNHRVAWMPFEMWMDETGLEATRFDRILVRHNRRAGTITA